MSLIKRLEESEGPIKIGGVPMSKIYVDSLLEEIKTLRERLHALTAETDEKDKPITKATCPWCGELPTEVQEDVVGVSGSEEGWAVNCPNYKCGALGPIRRYRKPAIAAWEKREKAKK